MKRHIFTILGVLTYAALVSAATVNVSPGSGTLKTAVTNATAGDILVLTDGEYTAEPTSPCGACRQVLAEIEHRAGRPMRLLLYSRTGIIVIESVGALLPLQFNGDNL